VSSPLPDVVPKTPAGPLQPITTKRLREIFLELGWEKMMPPDDKLQRLAAIYTGLQDCDLPPEPLSPEPEKNYPTQIDAFGNRVQLPLLGPVPFDWHLRGIGHPRYAQPTTWPYLVDEHSMVVDFHTAIGRKLGTRATARFLERVIPLITREMPSATTIRQYLATSSYRKRKRKRKRIHPPTT
jgi:hypothetical protein